MHRRSYAIDDLWSMIQLVSRTEIFYIMRGNRILGQVRMETRVLRLTTTGVTMTVMLGLMVLIVSDCAGSSPGLELKYSGASFFGESVGDRSAHSVAVVGDVNGDGFDDILIGAQQNGDGGSGAGQTYLILGKRTGWESDINLSNANASFWGEEPNDFSGNSIAGVGDVNGDGKQEILSEEYRKWYRICPTTKPVLR